MKSLIKEKVPTKNELKRAKAVCAGLFSIFGKCYNEPIPYDDIFFVANPEYDPTSKDPNNKEYIPLSVKHEVSGDLLGLPILLRNGFAQKTKKNGIKHVLWTGEPPTLDLAFQFIEESREYKRKSAENSKKKKMLKIIPDTKQITEFLNNEKIPNEIITETNEIVKPSVDESVKEYYSSEADDQKSEQKKLICNEQIIELLSDLLKTNKDMLNEITNLRSEITDLNNIIKIVKK